MWDSSSQVIALDADIEDLGEAAVSGLSEIGFEEVDAGVMLTEDFSDSPAEDLGMGYPEAGGGQRAAAAEQPYTVWNVVLLSACGTFALIGRHDGDRSGPQHVGMEREPHD